MVRVLAPPGRAGISPADSSVPPLGRAGIALWATSRGWDARLGARASRPQTAVCRLLGARARCPGSPHEGGTPAWERGRLARRQQCDPSRERGHLGRAGISPADSSVTHHGRAGILGARARCPGSPHEGGTPSWECGRLTRRQQCDPSRERGHRALGRLTRVGRPPGSAGVSPADSSVTHHGRAGIAPWVASRGWDARLGARASRPQTAV